MQSIHNKNIVKLVTESIRDARVEIVATMLLREEVLRPLPYSYHSLIKNKVKKKVLLKRLGFGKIEDYNIVKKREDSLSKNYIFKFTTREQEYQRLIIIDRKKIFFGKDGMFFKSEYEPLIKVFLKYFLDNFRKGKI